MQNLSLHNLGSYEIVWVIGAVKGRASSLKVLADKILKQQQLLDRLVFTGNILGPSYEGKNFSAKAIQKISMI